VERRAVNILTVQYERLGVNDTVRRTVLHLAFVTVKASHVVTGEGVLALRGSNGLALEAAVIRVAQDIRTGSGLRNADLIVILIIVTTVAAAAIIGLTLLNKVRIAVNGSLREARGITRSRRAVEGSKIGHTWQTADRTWDPLMTALTEGTTLAFIMGRLTYVIARALDLTRIRRRIRWLRSTLSSAAWSRGNYLALCQLPLT